MRKDDFPEDIMIKTILWDIDGTILDFVAAEKVAIRKCFDIFGLGECDDAMLADYSAINEKYWQRLERGEMSKPEILVGRFIDFFKKYGIDANLAQAFNDEYQKRQGDQVFFCPQAMEILVYIRDELGLKQYAVTNGTKTAQQHKLETSGLDKIFEKVFISEDIGYEKPAHEFFEHVYQEISDFESKREIMIIGDSLTSDIKGGVQEGLVTCWYNPDHKPNVSGLKFEYEIAQLGEIEAILCK